MEGYHQAYEEWKKKFRDDGCSAIIKHEQESGNSMPSKSIKDFHLYYYNQLKKHEEEKWNMMKTPVQSINANWEKVHTDKSPVMSDKSNDIGNDPKVLKYDECTYSDVYKGSSSDHTMTHSNFMRYKCSSCHYGASNLDSVNNHKMKYRDHNIVPVNLLTPAEGCVRNESTPGANSGVILKLKDPKVKLMRLEEKQLKYVGGEVSYNVGLKKENDVSLDNHCDNTVLKNSDDVSRDNTVLRNSDDVLRGEKRDNTVLMYSDDVFRCEKRDNLVLISSDDVSYDQKFDNTVLKNSGDVSPDKKRKTNKSKTKRINASNKFLLQSLECPYTARYESQIIQHNMTHLKNETYSCRDCPFTAKCLYILKQHKKDHTENEVITCKYCPFTTNNKTTYLKHKVKHIEPKKRVIQCVECSFTANSRTKVQMHSLIHKSSMKIFQCEDCSFATTNNTFLKEHVIVHNKPEEGCFRCSECSFTTNSDSALTEHDLTHEKKLEIFRCRECSFATSNKFFLLKHKRSHKPKE